MLDLDSDIRTRQCLFRGAAETKVTQFSFTKTTVYLKDGKVAKADAVTVGAHVTVKWTRRAEGKYEAAEVHVISSLRSAFPPASGFPQIDTNLAGDHAWAGGQAGADWRCECG
ncbi:MAG: hypothetical protein KJ072_17540 [Verrucomicrobia bacterium]|nr:hypothetical protein [Verrucomicrobiota bacterium]